VKRLLIALPVAATFLVAALWLTRAHGVVFALRETGDPVGEPRWIVLHPLRDRQPERAAEAVLERLRAGSVMPALEPLSLSDAIRTDMAAKEARYPLKSWRLVNRTGQGASVKPADLVARGNDKELDGRVWVTISLDGPTRRWHVQDITAWY